MLTQFIGAGAMLAAELVASLAASRRSQTTHTQPIQAACWSAAELIGRGRGLCLALLRVAHGEGRDGRADVGELEHLYISVITGYELQVK